MDDKSLEVEQYKREMLAAILQLQADNAALKVEIKHLKGRSTFMIDSICDALDECSETVRLWNNQNLIKSPNPLLDAYGSGKPLPESGNEWSQPIGIFDTTQFPADKSEELEVLQAENKKLKEEQSLTEVHDFLKRFADEFHVWSYGKNGGGQGERFKSYAEAEEYYRHLASGPCSHVALEAHLTLKDSRLPNKDEWVCKDDCKEFKHQSTLAEKLVALEAENARLREAITQTGQGQMHWDTERDPEATWESYVSDLCLSALSQPTPTTGILELAAAAVKAVKAEDMILWAAQEMPFETSTQKLFRIVKELPQETRVLLEGLSGD